MYRLLIFMDLILLSISLVIQLIKHRMNTKDFCQTDLQRVRISNNRYTSMFLSICHMFKDSKEKVKSSKKK